MLPGELLHQIFEARAREYPDRSAVCALDQQATYKELDARANRLAHRLRGMGVGPDVLVGLCADRSIDLIVGLLGILKAGGAYVPIDPEYPAKRIQFLLNDSAAPVVVAVSRVADALDQCGATIAWIDQDEHEAVATDAPPAVNLTPKNLAYVIYTSGSTGTPKGVLIEHQNVVRLFTKTQQWFQFDQQDVWVLFHSISFDFSVWEIWGALLYGGRLVIAPAEVRRSPKEFLALLQAQQVTVLNQTPSAFRQLVAAEAAEPTPAKLDLRYVIFGGERLDLKLLEPWIARHGDQQPQLINMYGITETTVHVTYKPIRSEDLKHPELSLIGVPIPDLQIYLLDEAGQPVADGAPGEIYVAGPGLARGYLNRAALTAERFAEKQLPGQQEPVRLYRSGDRAVRLANGELAYVGRADDQIKVRGFRIEPREIELCLADHPQVETAIVAPRDFGDGDIRLVAYILPPSSVARAGSFSEDLSAALSKKASAELPIHMHPSAYHVIDHIPMTPQGKIDRAALWNLATAEPAAKAGPQEQRTANEQAIMEIAEEILQQKGLKVSDDLFDVGATSLSFIRIVARVNQQFGVSITGSELGDEATVARLAACVDEQIAKPLEKILA